MVGSIVEDKNIVVLKGIEAMNFHDSPLALGAVLIFKESRPIDNQAESGALPL
jgi:hypothetical protein